MVVPCLFLINGQGCVEKDDCCDALRVGVMFAYLVKVCSRACDIASAFLVDDCQAL